MSVACSTEQQKQSNQTHKSTTINHSFCRVLKTSSATFSMKITTFWKHEYFPSKQGLPLSRWCRWIQLQGSFWWVFSWELPRNPQGWWQTNQWNLEEWKITRYDRGYWRVLWGSLTHIFYIFLLQVYIICIFKYIMGVKQVMQTKQSWNLRCFVQVRNGVTTHLPVNRNKDSWK